MRYIRSALLVARPLGARRGSWLLDRNLPHGLPGEKVDCRGIVPIDDPAPPWRSPYAPPEDGGTSNDGHDHGDDDSISSNDTASSGSSVRSEHAKKYAGGEAGKAMRYPE